jgi:hypothetical protein
LTHRIPATLIAAALVCLVPCGPARATPAGDALQRTFSRELETFLHDQPMSATLLGDYRFDGELGLGGSAGLAQTERSLTRLERELGSIDMRGATLHERDDLVLLRAVIVGQRRLLAQARAGKDAGGPPFTLIATIFTMMLHKGEQDGNLWWDHVISRLEAAPAWLAAQRTLIVHPGRLQGETGSTVLTNAPVLFTGLLTGMDTELSAEKRARFEHARDATVAALADWKKWLDANDSSWPTNYAMGRAAYDRVLKDELLLPYDADGIAAIGQRTLEAAVADESDALADATAKAINLVDPTFAAAQGGGAVPTKQDEQFAFFRDALERLAAFTRQKHVVTIPPDIGTMKIVETPSFLQPLLNGPSMNPPPLLSRAKDGVIFLPPAKQTTGSTFADYDRDRVLLTTAHQVLPGHFLQLEIAKRNPDPVRRFAFDGAFSEGWAFYELRLLARLGLYDGDLDGRYALAQFERLRGARAVVDAKLATGEWPFDRAVSWFREKAGVDVATATAEVTRHALTPGLAFDYAVGDAQIDDLLAKVRARKAARFSLQAFNDDLLAHGTIPISVIAREMLAE